MGQNWKQENNRPFWNNTQLFSMGADVRFIDGKDEFSSFKGFYPADKIVSDIDPVFEQLEDILAIIKERQQIMANEVQKRQK